MQSTTRWALGSAESPHARKPSMAADKMRFRPNAKIRASENTQETDANAQFTWKTGVFDGVGTG